MVRLIATRSLRYAGEPIEKDGEFQANEKDAKVLVLLDRAYVAQTAPAESTAPKKRRYRRRDIVSPGAA